MKPPANPDKKAYLQIHVSVILWGFTAILGRLITLHEMPLVWYRVLIVSLSLLFFPGLIRKLRLTNRNGWLHLAGIGCLVSLHWVCFYGSIKYSNVTVALSCLATTSFFTSFLEPLIAGRKIRLYEISIGFLVIPGVYLIFYFTEMYTTGIILGLLAAVLAAVFSSFNKRMLNTHEPQSMTFIELSSGFIFLSLLMPFYLQLFPEADISLHLTDLVYLIILGIGCTTIPFILSLHALRQLSAFTTALIINLEPLYGIALAILVFHENRELDVRFYSGTLILLAAVFIHPLLKKRFDRQLPIQQ
jgi:drug/metabolite transporter (DMT)-like permease